MSRLRGFVAVVVASVFGMVSVPLTGSAAPPVDAAEAPTDGEATDTQAPPMNAGPANADFKAAILPIAVEGEMSDADRDRLTQELVDGLQRGNFAIVSPTEVEAAVSNADSCDKKRCYSKIGDKTGASHIVRSVVTVNERDYDVSVALIDPANGNVLASSQESCEICGIADAGGLLSAASATLRTKLEALASGPASLQLASEPTGAIVSIDGEVAGTTPLDMPVVPGKKVIRISAEGYIAIEREVTFVEGVSESLSFELEEVPSKLPGATWGWVSLGVGTAGLGSGIALTYLHGRENKRDCSRSNATKDGDGDCKFLWNTKWAGAGASIAGAALLTLGVAILINSGVGKKNKGSKKPKKEKAEVSEVGLGPGSILIRGRF